MAKSTKLTPELQEKIVRYLRAGNYAETAVAACGIAKDTFYAWLRKGAKGQKPYAEFAAAVDKALAEAEAFDLAIIGKAAQKTWQAAAWRLERRMPDKYGRHDRMKVETNVDAAGGALLAKLAKLLEGGDEPKKRGRPKKEPDA